MKKIILTVFAATSLLLYSTPSFALFSVSVGVPVGSTLTAPADADGDKAESDGASGYFLGVQLPFAVGLGIDSYKTKQKGGNRKVATSMYNIFYQLPIPVLNLIIGLGTGEKTIECPQFMSEEHTKACSEYFKKGGATQWYTSIGIPLIPLFDIHLSYRSVTSKTVEYIGPNADGSKIDFGETVTGLGIAFNF